MKIIIVGLGKVGQLLTQTLAAENHDLIVIDLNKEKVNDIVNQYDVNGIYGNGATSDVLEQADVAHTDMIISVTSADELNILVGMIGKKLGVRHAIARVRNPEYSKLSGFFRDQFGFSMIANPEAATAEEILRLVLFPTASSIETFAKGKIELVGIRMHERSRLNEHALHQLSHISKANILICAVRRDNEITIPSGNFIIKAGDVVYVTGTHRDISVFCLDIGNIQRKIKNVMIVGGSRIAYYLCKMLSGQGIRVKIIEQNHQRCRELAEKLPYATIIEGDGSDEELLVEEGIETTDALVCLTGMDEENIILSLLAKQLNVNKAIAKVNSSTVANAVAKLNIDSIISPKQVIANQIIGYVRAKSNEDESGAVQTMYRLVDDQVEALEFIAGAKARYIGTDLNTLPIKPQVLVAAILRNNEIIVPKGTTTIETGDHLIIVAKNSKISHLNDIFEV